jgi:hypothetical protein
MFLTCDRRNELDSPLSLSTIYHFQCDPDGTPILGKIFRIRNLRNQNCLPDSLRFWFVKIDHDRDSEINPKLHIRPQNCMASVGAHLEELRTTQRDKFFIIYDVLHNWEGEKKLRKILDRFAHYDVGIFGGHSYIASFFVCWKGGLVSNPHRNNIVYMHHCVE